jgi:hypothetical protein
MSTSIFYVDKNTLSVYLRYMAARGRPKKLKAERRERQLHIVLTDAEQVIIEEAARADDLSTSAWSRRILLAAAKARRGKDEK